MKRTWGSWLALLAVLLFCGCAQDEPANPLDPLDVQQQEKEGEDSAGNNLSFPVIWSDGFAIPLRGEFGVAMFDGAYDDVDGVSWYHQRDVYNEWQAESADWSTAPVNISWIDWGDNIESRSWPERAKVRVEVVLFQDLITPMVGYEMLHLSGQGIEELWGTNTVTYAATQATVYTHNARLTIQKLTVAPDQADLAWDPLIGAWSGDVEGEPFYNSTVWESGEGPGDGYKAEINIQGKIIYGMLWDLAEDGDGPGHYRLTFSLDGTNGDVALNTYFDGDTEILQPVEEEGDEMADKAEPTGGITHIDTINNLSFIDVVITAGGGGGGGGNPHDGGGGEGNGPRH